jgi:hypothetical protein
VCEQAEGQITEQSIARHSYDRYPLNFVKCRSFRGDEEIISSARTVHLFMKIRVNVIAIARHSSKTGSSGDDDHVSSDDRDEA